MLCGAVEAIRQTIRQTDLLARYGGEEFFIYLPETNHSQAAEIAEDIRTAFESRPVPIENGARTISVTISIGLLSIETFGGGDPARAANSLNQWFIAVDEALYQAKKEGRNRVVGKRV